MEKTSLGREKARLLQGIMGIEEITEYEHDFPSSSANHLPKAEAILQKA